MMSFPTSRKLKLNRVTFIAFRELAKACKDGKLAEEELPAWTSGSRCGKITKAQKGLMRNIMWNKIQTFLRHLTGETEEKGTIA